MLDSICIDQSTCQERVESDKIQNKKSLSTGGLEATTLRILAWCSTDWTTWALMTAFYYSELHTYMYMYFWYQCIYWYTLENDEEERILSCTSTQLFCVAYYNISMLGKYQRDAQVLRLFSTCKTRPNYLPDQVEYLVVFCMLKTNTWLLRLFVICPI